MSEKQTIQFVVPANLHNSSFVRRISDDVLKKAKFSKEWCNRLKLVADELFMNAVKYGSNPDKSEVYITFSYDENEIKFTIEDDGTGSQSISVEELQNKIQQNEKNTDLARTSGRGLSMITKQWTDGMEVSKSERGGLAITFIKKIEPVMKAKTDVSVQSVVSPTPVTPQVEGIHHAAHTQTSPNKATEFSKIPKSCSVQEFKLSGEIDQSNVIEKTTPIFEYVKTIPAGCSLVLDFSNLKYINSTFIGSLASWYTTMRGKGGYVRLLNVNNQIREILALVGLTDLLEIA